jgi:hypothetical protein
MNRTRVLIGALLALFTLFCGIVWAQSVPRDWAVFNHLPYGEKLRVEVKNQKTVTGKFAWTSDSTLTLLIDDKPRNISRTDVDKVYRILSKSVARTTAKGAKIGATTGAMAGDAVGEDCSQPHGNICINRNVTIPIGAAVGAIPGAAAGATVAELRHNKQLIYQR